MPRPQTEKTTSRQFAPLTDDDIRAQTDEGSFSRGRSYFRNGRIREPILRGDTIEAQCIGSEPYPYRVTATLAPTGSTGENPKAASCTCPRGGFCKHIVALLLTWIDAPETFRELAPVADQLADRSPEQLIDLIERMVHRYPDLQRLIDLPPAPVMDARAGVAANALIIDISPLQRQIRSSLTRYDRYGRDYGWDDWGEWDTNEIPAEIAPIVDLMQRYAQTSQWANAQAVATALAEEALDVLTGDEDLNGELGAVVIAADAMLASTLHAQAALPADQRLSVEQRRELLQAIYAIWRADIFEVGGFDLSQSGIETLVRDATDEERRMVETWLRAEQANDWARDAVIELIADLREAGGADDTELFELYHEMERWGDAAIMLVSMGRIDEAVAMATRRLREPGELTQFADALVNQGEEYASRAIGLVDDLLWEEEGKNAGHDSQLRAWLQRQYGAHGREGDALKLARRQFDHTPNIYTYNAVAEVATLPGQPDGTWDNVRPELLLTLKSKNAWADIVNIHLAAHEGMAALEALDTLKAKQAASAQLSPFWGGGAGSLSVQVAAAVERDAPDRAIAIYRHAADQAIAGRNRQSYQSAAEHLARVKAILEREGRGREWRTFFEKLREEHKRLPALQEELHGCGLG